MMSEAKKWIEIFGGRWWSELYSVIIEARGQIARRWLPHHLSYETSLSPKELHLQRKQKKDKMSEAIAFE